MSLYDDYEPDPELPCPVCGRRLHGWQGKDGPCGLMIWRQGHAAPVDQSLDEGSRLQPEDLARHHLPAIFTIYAFCCSNRFPVEAIGRTVDGTWSSTEIVTTERARQRKDETRAQFKARLAWLSGRD